MQLGGDRMQKAWESITHIVEWVARNRDALVHNGLCLAVGAHDLLHRHAGSTRQHG